MFGMNFYSVTIMWVMMSLVGGVADLCIADEPKVKWPGHIQIVLDATKPLEFDRGRRLPLYLWQAMNPGLLGEDDAQELLEQLDERGIGLVCHTDWRLGMERRIRKAWTLGRDGQ